MYYIKKVLTKSNISKCLKELLLLQLGCIFFGCSMVLIGKVNIIPGNIIGVAKIITLLCGGQIGRINLLFNIPIIAVGVWLIGKKLLVYTLLTVFETSILVDQWVPRFARNPRLPLVIVVIISGIFMGAAVALILRAGGTTGGTTALVRIIIEKFPNFKAGNLLLILDGIIIVAGGILLSDYGALIYSIFFEYVICVTLDAVNNGLKHKERDVIFVQGGL